MNKEPSKLVFVTGASGFLASHIIRELLEQGYRVRASGRGSKIAELRKQYSLVGVEIVQVQDVARDRFPLDGVDAIIHTAAPLAGNVDAEIMFDTTIEGTLNVLRQGEAAGIRKYVLTNSIVSVFGDPAVVDQEYRDHHWNPITKEIAFSSNNPIAIYSAAKKYAELAAWEWAGRHSDIDLTILNPPLLYGPLSPLYKPTKQGALTDAISTNLHIYNLLNPAGPYPISPGHSDVRDVARAHVGALSTPPSVKGRKRVVNASPYDFDYKEIVELIRKERPTLAARLIGLPASELDVKGLKVDLERQKEITGVGKEDLHSVEQTVLDTVDFLVALEAAWEH